MIGGDAEFCKCLDDLGFLGLVSSNPEMFAALRAGGTFNESKEAAYTLLTNRERWLRSLECDLEPLERTNALNCVMVLRNFLSEYNVKRVGIDSFWYLWGLAHNDMDVVLKVRRAFVIDLLKILMGSLGKSGIYREEAPNFLEFEGMQAAEMRSENLDRLASKCLEKIRSYPTGLDREVIERRKKNRLRIQGYMGGDRSDWEDYRWQLSHVIRDLDQLENLIELTDDEKMGVRIAVENKIPFGITPYYLSLMDYQVGRKWDHAVRAQVIPPLGYVMAVLAHRENRRSALDFMKERETSPVGLVTRRYPMIAILKPYNTCAQICVYCQRNWEIAEPLDPNALAITESVNDALNWFKAHPTVIEILITGGDPALMDDTLIESILERIDEIPHVERVRIGTGVPVVLPMRITDTLVHTLRNFHRLPRREISIVTHIEHPYEITPEMVEAVLSLRKKGMSVYNQQVFTLENSRRFETSALRLTTKRAGVDPYYTFNMKGKEETNDYRVPIARYFRKGRKRRDFFLGWQEQTNQCLTFLLLARII